MINLEQIVETKWSTHNIKRYKSFGYEFTSINKTLFVKAKELPENSRVKVAVKCDYCGQEYSCSYCTIAKSNGKHACSTCAPEKANELRHKRMAKEKIQKAKDICDLNNYELLTTIEEYAGVKMQVEFICKKHGLQRMMLDNLLRGHKCCDCSYEERGNNLKIDTSQIDNLIKMDGNTWLNTNDYKDANHNNLLIKCRCGNTFTTSYNNYKMGRQTRCAICSQKESLGEKYIREYLESHQIMYVQEKRFEECKDQRQLPFDFYIPKYNMCIEFDGPHHFRPVYSEEHFEKTKQHDKIKDDYCAKKGILLIRIYYYNSHKDVDNILNSVFNLWVKDIV